MERMKVKKGNLFIYIVLLAVAIAVMFYTRGLSKQHAGGCTTPDSDTIVVGIQITPMGVSTNGDTLSGFCYEMLRAMTASKGIKLDIEGFTQVSTALDRLKKGIYDIVVADIPSTTELKEESLLTIPIFTDHQVIVQRTDSLTHLPPAMCQANLGGDTIFIAKGSPLKSRIINLSHEICDTIFEDDMYNPEQMMIRVAQGKIKNAVVNKQLADNVATEYPNLDTSLELFSNQFPSWIIDAKNHELLNRMDSCITGFKKTAEFGSLVEKYIGRTN